jgi:hypothetical protein
MALAVLIVITIFCIAWSLWPRRVTWTCRWGGCRDAKYRIAGCRCAADVAAGRLTEVSIDTSYGVWALRPIAIIEDLIREGLHDWVPINRVHASEQNPSLPLSEFRV